MSVSVRREMAGSRVLVQLLLGALLLAAHCDSHSPHERMMSLLVYLDDVDDSLVNREVVTWTGNLIESRIYVEYFTGTPSHLLSSSSPVVSSIMRSNCALRPIPSEISPLEDMRSFLRYVQKFDLVLVTACITEDCLSRLRLVTGGIDNFESPMKYSSPVKPRVAMYVPELMEKRVCKDDLSGLVKAVGSMSIDVVMVSVEYYNRWIFKFSLTSHCAHEVKCCFDDMFRGEDWQVVLVSKQNFNIT